MKASEMIKTIKYVETECHGISQMYKQRIAHFQSRNLPETVGVEYDSAFVDFVVDLETTLGGKVNIPTAKKILNNWYIWAKENLDALNKIKPFTPASDPKEWLVKNHSRIDHVAFAKDVKKELIQNIEEKMPRDSIQFGSLKKVADEAYPSPRGFTYEYLVKVVAGFSENWN